MKYQSENLHCIICGRSPVDLDHIKTRGSGGTDEPFNFIPSCSTHHRERHAIGLISYSEKYPEVKRWLLMNEWYQEEGSGKWKHD